MRPPPHIHFMISAMGYPQLVTQMYFKGEEIIDNSFVQELNKKDLLLQNTNVPESEKDKLVVHFTPQEDQTETRLLTGEFNITLKL